jgi:photosystem II stability/assembly factor-like uncharacterized protein
MFRKKSSPLQNTTTNEVVSVKTTNKVPGLHNNIDYKRMKAKKYFIVGLLLCYGALSYAQCGVEAGDDVTITCGGAVQLNMEPIWSKRNDSIAGIQTYLHSVFFVNSDTGYTVGVFGTIHKTIDGGKNWITQTSGTTLALNSVFFTDVNTGYIVGGSDYNTQVILKTIDGGDNWSVQTSNSIFALNSVCFTNTNTGYAVGSNGVILKTTDGGTNWLRKTGNSTLYYTSVHFPDPNIGYAAADGGLFKTVDAGEHWLIINASGGLSTLGSLFFTDINTGYLASSNAVYKTVNGGDTWNSVGVFGNLSARSIFFTDANTGYVGGGRTLWKTTNAGNSWRSQNVDTYVFGIHFPNSTIGYATGDKTIKYIAPDIISWTPSIALSTTTTANPIANPTVTTKYKVTTTTTGCISTDSVLVFVNPLTADAGADKTLTCGGSVQLNTVITNYTGAGTLLYSWFPVSGLSATNISNPVATVTQNTKFYVMVTTPNGCTAMDSVTVIVNPLTANAGGRNKGIICGSSVQLDNVTTNYTGSGSLNYSWSPTAGLNSAMISNPIASPVSTTLYKITVSTTSGCIVTDSVLVSVFPLTIDAMSNKTITCGGSVQLDKVITSYVGGGTLTYSWLPHDGLNAENIPDPIASPTHTTKYYIKVTSPTGCSVTDSVTVFVNPFVGDAGNDHAIVCGGNAQLDNVLSNYSGSGTLSYSWSPATGLNSTTITNPVSNVTSTTKYKVTVTTPNGCSSTDSVTVFVGPLTANAGADKKHICGGSAQLDNVITNYTGTGPLVYTWLPILGLNNTHIENPVTTASGITYTVTITTTNGCTSSDQVAVNLIEMNSIDICMVSVDSTKNIVSWNKPVNGAIASFNVFKETTVAGNYTKIGSVPYNQPGVFRDIASQPETSSNKYKISIIDTCGLESLTSAAHKTMHLTINKGTGIVWNLIWESYEGFPVATYKIYRGTSPTNLVYFDATSGSNTQYSDNNPPIGDIYYQLEVINPNPCDNQFYSTRSNVARSKKVGINEIPNTLVFSIYPNPATEQLTVNVEKKSNEPAYLIIYNTLGAAVKKVLLEQSKQQINVSDLDNGFYTIEIKSANYRGQEKLIIQK